MKKLIIPMTKKELKVKDVSKTKKEILRIISDEVSDCLQHFEEKGWKLDKDYLQYSILTRILGFAIGDEISQAFVNAGLVIEFHRGKTYIRTKEEYMPIYMHVVTGKLHIIENSDDKHYLDKFCTSKGYVAIGRL